MNPLEIEDDKFEFNSRSDGVSNHKFLNQMESNMIIEPKI